MSFQRPFLMAAVCAALLLPGPLARSAPAQTTAQTPAPQVFRIQPVRPVDELRRLAAKEQPPQERGAFLPFDLIDLTGLDPLIRLDIRYATANNFLGTPLYTEARAVMQRSAAEALERAHRQLQKQGYGLLIHDGYRPWAVTWIFWQATPADKHQFVANPATGSRHNRGCAVDLTLYDLKTGRPVEMPSLYDEMTERASPNYTGGTADQRRLRDRLRAAMEAEGFSVESTEWWHFDYKEWRRYQIGNVSFDSVARPKP
jgi:D-alanyl-D-alanine dipeptidase